MQVATYHIKRAKIPSWNADLAPYLPPAFSSLCKASSCFLGIITDPLKSLHFLLFSYSSKF